MSFFRSLLEEIWLVPCYAVREAIVRWAVNSNNSDLDEGYYATQHLLLSHRNLQTTENVSVMLSGRCYLITVQRWVSKQSQCCRLWLSNPVYPVIKWVLIVSSVAHVWPGVCQSWSGQHVSVTPACSSKPVPPHHSASDHQWLTDHEIFLPSNITILCSPIPTIQVSAWSLLLSVVSWEWNSSDLFNQSRF